RGVFRMDESGRTLLPLQRGRRFGEAGIEEVACRRGNQPEGMLFRGELDAVPLVRQPRHAVVVRPHGRPVGGKSEFAVGPAETVKETAGAEIRLAVMPALRPQRRHIWPARSFQRTLDDLDGTHPEPGMLGAEPLRQLADHVMVLARLARRL